MTFSQAIRATRASLNMTQAQFANELRVSCATMNRWENGKHIPTPIVLGAIETYCEKHGINFCFEENNLEN